MTIAATVVVPTATGWLRGLWAYYRRYTDTTVHTAATAALAIFGILVFVDPWFAALAIGSYVVPPVVLYALDVDAPLEDGHTPTREQESESGPAATTRREQSAAARATAPEGARSSGNRATGTDLDTTGNRAGGDTDSDGNDGDTDSDSDDGDTDSDSDDGDTDSDSDDGDTDSDIDDGDTDSDSDDGDTDSDSDA